MLRPIQIPSSLHPPQPLAARPEGSLRLDPSSRFGAREAAGNTAATPAPSMMDFLVDRASEVNEMQQHADGMVHELLTGGNVQSAEVLTAVQKADMAFRTMLQVRNKLIDAYREILQIQV